MNPRNLDSLWVLATGLTLVFLGAPSAFAQQGTDDAGSDSSADTGAEDDAAAWAEFAQAAKEETEVKVFDVRLYGYLDSYFEKVADTPASIDEDGETVFESNPHEFDVLNLHVMVQGTIQEKYRFFLNLVGSGSGGIDDAPVGVRNAWVEAPLWSSFFLVRAGKTYRRFGLYNEILDAVPTFIGVEPPELFDKDHLFLTRTTNLMVHGTIPVGDNTLSWSLTTGNDERTEGAVPIGADVRYIVPGRLTVGTSFYHSGGDAVSSTAVGDGSPRGGAKPWMASDEYFVVGGFAEVFFGALQLQAAYWLADHDGTRDPDALAVLGASAGLNARQLERFFVDGDPANQARTDASYQAQTFYTRAGYSISFAESGMELVPYAQFDWFSDPEAIADKSFGGDGEAGLTDDGEFFKVTVGSVFRPIPQVALKVDGSAHIQQFNGETVFYPEVRVSFSYLWELL